jgi:hypothetical protein
MVADIWPHTKYSSDVVYKRKNLGKNSPQLIGMKAHLMPAHQADGQEADVLNV